MSTPRHVIFGTGAVGRATLAALLRRGERPQDVRMVNRSGSARVPDGIEVAAGDATDPAFSTAVAAGSQVVYQTLNPPYHRWAEEFPGLQAGVVAAAASAGARLVSVDNVYMYGPPLGRPFTEGHADAPTTRKGTVRARMARDLLAAHRAGHVEVTIGRASNYFGPGGAAQSVLGDAVFKPALRGLAIVLGDPDQPHTYTYIPDIGEGLALLGEHPDAAGEVWHLPNDPVTRTTRQLVTLVHEAAGHPKAKVRSLPAVVLRTLGVANPPLRELTEMLYEFQEPFVVDSTKITKHLGATATPAEEALNHTLDTYRAAARS